MAKVLLVDDEKGIRVTLGEFLRGDGHEVIVAADAESACRLLAEQAVDVLLTDIVLPGRSGIELLNDARRLQPEAVAVVMTGEPGVATVSEALRLGALDYIVKPAMKRQVLKVVSAAARVKILADEKPQPARAGQRGHADLERLVAERTQALRQSETRYRRLVQHTPDGIAVVQDDKVVFLNQPLATMLGVGVEDLVGTPFLNWVRDRDRQTVAEALAAAIRTARSSASFEVQLCATAETRVVAEIVVLPFTNAGGTAAQVMVRDITAHRELEERLMQAQRLEAIGQLTGGVAHDFNNLLQVIGGYTEIARGRKLEGPIRDDLAAIAGACERAAELVRQLLIFSHRQQMECQYLNIDNLVENLLKMLRRVIGETIKIVFEPGAADDVVYADPGQLEQVLMNLAVNARDAMPDGGVLTIRTASVEATDHDVQREAGLDPAPYVMLIVRDTGCGMSDTVCLRIFEPFYTTKPAGSSTGLGLATVHGIVTQHGGRVIADSTPGSGSAFRVYLPATLPEIEEPAAEIELGDMPGGHETLLIAEDDPLVRKLAVRIVENAGYSVVTAEDGAVAIRVFDRRADDIDLAVLDVIMPGVSGQGVYDHIKQRRPGLPVLFSSGYQLDETGGDLSRVKAAGGFIRKPYAPTELLRQVRELLDGRAAPASGG